MSIAESAIPPQLPPVSVLPPVPLRRPDELSETMSGNIHRETAEPNINRASWKREAGKEKAFQGIVGRSAALQRALREVEVVASTDSGVLILGETGTGKELVARSIHNLSARRDRPLIKLNCAAIPSGLLESELFGHERGAFTGALMRKAGRFEAADKGTLFLDEVGDIPLELQPKLLRVLQEHEFERLGSTHTQQVDCLRGCRYPSGSEADGGPDIAVAFRRVYATEQPSRNGRRCSPRLTECIPTVIRQRLRNRLKRQLQKWSGELHT